MGPRQPTWPPSRRLRARTSRGPLATVCPQCRDGVAFDGQVVPTDLVDVEVNDKVVVLPDLTGVEQPVEHFDLGCLDVDLDPHPVAGVDVGRHPLGGVDDAAPVRRDLPREICVDAGVQAPGALMSISVSDDHSPAGTTVTRWLAIASRIGTQTDVGSNVQIRSNRHFGRIATWEGLAERGR